MRSNEKMVASRVAVACVGLGTSENSPIFLQEIQMIFIILVICYLPFSFSFSHQFTMEFCRNS